MTDRNPTSPRRAGPKAADRPRRSPVIGALVGLGRFLGRRPGLVLASVAISGGVGVFSWNALMKQPGAHPAPLFASAKPPVALAEPPRRPDFQGTAFARPEPASTGTARPAPDQPIRASSSAGDGIGALIRSGEPPRPGDAATPPRQPDAKTPSPRVATVQKALVKAGYGPIDTDGVAGAMTKQALERFERDRNLPVTGTMGQRTLKQLAAVSGIRIE